jgi:hypothetical protein
MKIGRRADAAVRETEIGGVETMGQLSVIKDEQSKPNDDHGELGVTNIRVVTWLNNEQVVVGTTAKKQYLSAANIKRAVKNQTLMTQPLSNSIGLKNWIECTPYLHPFPFVIEDDVGDPMEQPVPQQ